VLSIVFFKTPASPSVQQSFGLWFLKSLLAPTYPASSPRLLSNAPSKDFNYRAPAKKYYVLGLPYTVVTNVLCLCAFLHRLRTTKSAFQELLSFEWYSLKLQIVVVLLILQDLDYA